MASAGSQNDVEFSWGLVQIELLVGGWLLNGGLTVT